MTEIKAIIVDDERRARNVLSSLLERNCPEVQVLSECSNVPDAVLEIKKHSPDLVFLDVQMPNYAGYEIVKFFDEINFEIIFVTAYDKYAIKAFELSAVDYLIKPINRSRLSEAVNKLRVKLTEKHKLANYTVLLESIQQEEFKQIVIPELGNRRIIDLSNIVAIEADGAYSKVHLVDSSVITVSKTLKYFESVLPQESIFFRSHRAWIVNTSHLKEFNKTTNAIYLNHNITAKISRNKLIEFEKAMC